MNFVIITTEADDNIKAIHGRMPLMIKDDFLDYWSNNNTSMKVIEEIFQSNKNNEFLIERWEDESKKATNDGYQQLRMF